MRSGFFAVWALNEAHQNSASTAAFLQLEQREGTVLIALLFWLLQLPEGWAEWGGELPLPCPTVSDMFQGQCPHTCSSIPFCGFSGIHHSAGPLC